MRREKVEDGLSWEVSVNVVGSGSTLNGKEQSRRLAAGPFEGGGHM